MNNQLWGMLNATEQQLVRETEASALDGLDEDRLAELHDRVRRARNKYTKLYRRRARAQVGSDASRARAHAQHARTAAKAEVFEDLLARVSTRLARAARVSARELRDERLAAARGTSKPVSKSARKKPSGRKQAPRAKVQRRTPATRARSCRDTSDHGPEAGQRTSR